MNLIDMINKSFNEENFMKDLVGTKSLKNLTEKYQIDVKSDMYKSVIKKSIDRLNKELLKEK